MGDIVVLAILALVIGLVIRSMIQNRKKHAGCSACSGCTSCSMCQSAALCQGGSTGSAGSRGSAGSMGSAGSAGSMDGSCCRQEK